MEENANQGKRQYESPQITIIDLRPEEAVLGNCKNTNSMGSGFGSCQQAGGGACIGHGS